jgi:hypothetical protein
VREALADQPLELLDRTAQEDRGINHRRSGDLIAVAAPDAWFDYRWWTDPAEAPVFARTVDIHRKPGYDPLELFLDPAARAITQDATRVKGSHGRVDAPDAVLIGADTDMPQKATDVAPHIASMLGL